MSLQQRLQAMQMKETVQTDDLDHMTREQLAKEVIDFGGKHKGKSYHDVWVEDQEWVMFMVSRYPESLKPSHRKFLRYVDLQLSEHEKHQLPVPVMKKAVTPVAINNPKNALKAKAKASSAYSTQVHDALVPTVDSEEEWLSGEMCESQPPIMTSDPMVNENVMALQDRMQNMEQALGRVIQFIEEKSLPQNHDQ